MRAILLGGPRHLEEFEIGTPPFQWVVPKPIALTLPSPEEDPFRIEPRDTFFETVTYRLESRVGGYAIYLSEDGR